MENQLAVYSAVNLFRFCALTSITSDGFEHAKMKYLFSFIKEPQASRSIPVELFDFHHKINHSLTEASFYQRQAICAG